MEFTFTVIAEKIIRDHGNKTGFFRVDVPEVGHTGFGFLLRRGPAVYVVSFTRIKKVPSVWGFVDCRNR